MTLFGVIRTLSQKAIINTKDIDNVRKDIADLRLDKAAKKAVDTAKAAVDKVKAACTSKQE